MTVFFLSNQNNSMSRLNQIDRPRHWHFLLCCYYPNFSKKLQESSEIYTPDKVLQLGSLGPSYNAHQLSVCCLRRINDVMTGIMN